MESPKVEKEITLENMERIRVAYEKTKIEAEAILNRRHAKKPYHSPPHTIGNGDVMSGTETGVRSAAVRLATIFGDCFPSIVKDNPKALLMFQALDGGMTSHDQFFKILGIDKNGRVVRDRGYPGGNEWWSSEEHKKIFLKHYLGGAVDARTDPYEVDQIHQQLLKKDLAYATYMRSVENTIAATDPDEFVFGAAISRKRYDAGHSELVWDGLRNPEAEPGDDDEYVGLRLDSTKSRKNLEGLFAGTADIGVSGLSAGRFFHTGNGEFWEFNYQISKDCTQYDRLSKGRAKEILHAMQGWRKTQIGVVMWQKIRFEENYTVPNITRLITEAFGVVPEAHEVESFIQQARQMYSAFAESLEVSAQKHAEFTDRFINQIGSDDEAQLTVTEIALMREAIEYMSGDPRALEEYIASVDAEIEKHGLSRDIPAP